VPQQRRQFVSYHVYMVKIIGFSQPQWHHINNIMRSLRTAEATIEKRKRKTLKKYMAYLQTIAIRDAYFTVMVYLFPTFQRVDKLIATTHQVVAGG